MSLKQESDALFALVKSLTKAEKKNFKLFITRHSKQHETWAVVIFDLLDKQKKYDEQQILKKCPTLSKPQFLNVKHKLYQEVLNSLRLLKEQETIPIKINEQIDHALVLYSKGLYLQSLKMLEKVKQLAFKYHQTYQIQYILLLEKNIENLHITRSLEGRAESLAMESNTTLQINNQISSLSNLSLQLYSWFIKFGHARNTSDREALKLIINEQLPQCLPQNFYSLLFYYQSLSWYYFIIQDFLNYYKFSWKWTQLFQDYPEMQAEEVMHHLKGLHNLTNAQFYLRNYKNITKTTEQLEAFYHTEAISNNISYKVKCFIYLYTAKINLHFLHGKFDEGLALVPEIDNQLEDFQLYLDQHRTLIFYYKIACLYFGAGQNNKAIEYLNKIIHWKIDLRIDLQCYARLLHLIAHFELGHYELLEYLSKSVYRIFLKMKNLSLIEQAVFQFLRTELKHNYLKKNFDFKSLLTQLKAYENDPLESRAYIYLDIISWLESKLEGTPVQTIIRNKYLKTTQ